MAAAPYKVYDNDEGIYGSPLFVTTKQATDHRQITLLEAEWHDLKRYSKCIVIETQKFDWFSLFLGAALSTIVSFLYGLFNYFTKDQNEPFEIIFYAFITILLLGIALSISFRGRNKTDALSISRVQHDNLCLKIEEIENRVKSEPLGDV